MGEKKEIVKPNIDLKKAISDFQKLCWEIEKLPASEQQTKISVMASDLYHLLLELGA